MDLFDKFVLWISTTPIYIKYISQWPAPLNNVSFLAVIILVLIVIFVKGLYETISNYRFHARIKRKRRKLQEKEIDKELHDREKHNSNAEDDELMRMYMKFIMMAQMQNMASMSNMTFEQFKAQKTKMESSMDVSEPTKMDPPAKKEKQNRNKLNVSEIASNLTEKATSIAEKVSDFATDIGDKASDTLDTLKEKSSSKLPNAVSKSETVCQTSKEDELETCLEDKTTEESPIEEEPVDITAEDLLPESELVDLQDEDENYNIELPLDDVDATIINDSMEDVLDDLTNISEILETQESNADKVSVTDSENDNLDDFTRLMLQLEKQKDEKERSVEYETKASTIKENNLRVLNKQFEKSLNSVNDAKLTANSYRDNQNDADLDARKQAAIKQLQKEEARAKKAAEKEAKRALRKKS